MEPTYTCAVCGRVEIIRPDGRGFPPDIAERRLAKACKADGHEADPHYLAGFDPRLFPPMPETARTIEFHCPRCDSTNVRACGPGIPSLRSQWIVTDCFDCMWPGRDTRLTLNRR